MVLYNSFNRKSCDKFINISYMINLLIIKIRLNYNFDFDLL